jgi:hypothetical protein
MARSRSRCAGERRPGQLGARHAGSPRRASRGTGAFDPLSDASPFYAHEYLVSDDDGKIVRDTDLVQNEAFV